MRVLLVEDDPDQLSLRSLLLTHSGFECSEACTVDSALKLVEERSPRCAIVDLSLPTVSAGLELIRKLRDFDSRLCIVVLTGMDPAGFQKLPEATLVNSLFTKPFRSAELIATLKAIASH